MKPAIQWPPEFQVRERRAHTSNFDVHKFKLSDDQHEALGRIKAWTKSDQEESFYLAGYAGTGKTLVAAAVSDIAKKPVYCAFTGKASDVLSTRTPSHIAVSTIHSLAYVPRVNAQTRRLEGFDLRPFLEEGPFDLIVVDEASMVSSKVFQDLKTFEVPIMLVGDPAQLPPVQDEELRVEDFPVSFTLEKIHRQAEGSSILQLAEQVRTQRKWVKPKPSPGCRCISVEELPRFLRQAYDQYGPKDTVMLSYRNETRVALNEIGKQVHSEMVSLPGGSDPEFFDGVPVVALENYSSELVNGSRGTLRAPLVHQYWVQTLVENLGGRVSSVYAHLFGPQFDRPKTIKDFEEAHFLCPDLPSDKWGERIGQLFDFAYALTVHKAQGSSYPCVFLKLEKVQGASTEEFARWLYTGISRAEKELFIVLG